MLASTIAIGTIFGTGVVAATGNYLYQNSHEILFKLLVFREKMSRKITNARRHAASLLLASIDENGATQENGGETTPRTVVQWERSSVRRVRPLHEQVKSAKLFYKDGKENVEFTECLEIFRTFIQNPEFDDGQYAHSTVADFLNHMVDVGHTEYNEDIHLFPFLLIEYKRGLRTFAVRYRETIVFPPPSVRTVSQPLNVSLFDSTTVPSKPKRSISYAALGDHDDIDHDENMNVTALVKRYSGPRGDFYVGADFATTPRWFIENIIPESRVNTDNDGPILHIKMSDNVAYKVTRSDFSMPDLR